MMCRVISADGSGAGGGPTRTRYFYLSDTLRFYTF